MADGGKTYKLFGMRCISPPAIIFGCHERGNNVRIEYNSIGERPRRIDVRSPTHMRYALDVDGRPWADGDRSHWCRLPDVIAVEVDKEIERYGKDGRIQKES
jgi:hypothetical protein